MDRFPAHIERAITPVVWLACSMVICASIVVIGLAVDRMSYVEFQRAAGDPAFGQGLWFCFNGTFGNGCWQ